MVEKKGKQVKPQKQAVAATPEIGPSPGDLLGADSTAVSTIHTVMVEDKGRMISGEEVLQQLDRYVADEHVYTKDEAKAELKKGEDLLEQLSSRLNKAEAVNKAIVADIAILGGKSFLKMKVHCKAAGLYFGAYAAEHLSFISERTRQKWMQIARREDLHRYKVLGVEKMALLASETEKDVKTSSDPVGDLFCKYGLTFDSLSDVDIDVFQQEVDVALCAAKCEKEGIPVSKEELRELIEEGKKLDVRLLKELKLVRDSGGDVGVHLSNVILGGPEDEDEDSITQRVLGFNKAAEKVKGSIQFILDHPEHVGHVTLDQIELLQDRLDQLRALIQDSTPAEAFSHAD